MSKIIDDKPYVLDIMEQIQEERKRLDDLVISPDYKKNPQWNWMSNWLQKTNEEHYKTWFRGECNVCGKKARYFLKMDFSFCDEYGCDIKICSKCLNKMQKIFKDGVKEINRETKDIGA